MQRRCMSLDAVEFPQKVRILETAWGPRSRCTWFENRAAVSTINAQSAAEYPALGRAPVRNYGSQCLTTPSGTPPLDGARPARNRSHEFGAGAPVRRHPASGNVMRLPVSKVHRDGPLRSQPLDEIAQGAR